MSRDGGPPDPGGWVAHPRPTAAGTRVMVTGGTAPLHVDTEELAALRARLLGAVTLVEQALDHADAADAEVLGYFAPPVPAGIAVSAMIRQALYVGVTLGRLAQGVRDLADDVEVQRQWYEEAEQRASRVFRPPLWRYLVLLAPVEHVRRAAVGLDVVAVGGHLGAAVSRMRDPRLLDAVVAQEHARSLAGRMQWARPDALAGGMFLGARWVDVTRKTPVERTALAALPMLENASLVAHGGRTYPGLRVRPLPVPGTGRTPATDSPPGAPRPATDSPPGASRPGTALVTGFGRTVSAPPTTPAQALARIPALEREIRGRGIGLVEILRTTAPDGGRSWTVVVPGTQSPWDGGRQPMDNGTNLRAMAGVGSAMEAGVTSAMRQAGIAPGEPVAMAVHSQGGLVAARLVADPVFRARFDVRSLLTAGSPVAGVTLPASVATLSLEDVNDPTVGLDGYPNPPAPHHVTVAVHSGEPAGLGQAHHVESYAAAAGLLPGVADDGVRRWLAHNEQVMGTAVPGARTESLLFEIERTR
ncbi:hypothetical protein [Georgenia sp. AZ-5]|uniref:hypothetical protein n=1 Tax=Georgenia sp. AZ-5 TaxID=3367526 RepID=UPI00375474A1